jgi:biopolymer transport protein ExbD
MKLLLIFTILFSLCACGQNKKMTVNIYIAGCDSIFYCEGETFDPEAVHGSKSNDSIFINKLLNNITSENKKVLFKPYEGTCGDGNLGEKVMNVKSLLIQNNVEFKIANTDSAENKFFNDISVIDMFANLRKPPPPPPAIVVTSPDVSSREVTTAYFQFVLKANGAIYYNYDSTDLERNLIPIDHPTKEKLVQVLTAFEESHQIKFSEESIPIIVRGQASAQYSEFKIIKDALKAKDIFKFKIVTGGPTPPKKTEVEVPIVITGKTLTLLLSASDELFYYHGKDCSSLKKIKAQMLSALLNIETRNTAIKDLMVIVKQQDGGTFKTVVDILDDINLAIPAQHYAETGITVAEIKCIKNYKTK